MEGRERYEQAQALQYMQNRLTEAYHQSSTGNFLERWVPGVCKHPVVRCTHGDEIIGRNWRRRVCMVCGRALRGPIPEICFFTGKFHQKDVV